jgi:hypothetical protein
MSNNISATSAFGIVAIGIAGMVIGQQVTMFAVKGSISQELNSEQFQKQQTEKYIIDNSHNFALKDGSITMTHRYASIQKAIKNMCQYEANNSSNNNELAAECIKETTEKFLVLKK